VAGLVAVASKYQIGKVYMSGAVHTTPEYLAFLTALKTNNIPVQIVKSGDMLNFADGISLEFLFPLTSVANQTFENLNNSSVVTRLVWGKSSAIMMGDLESEGQDELLLSRQYLESDIIKVAHHGSKDSVNANFLKAVNPKYAVISAGKDNKFGHPSKFALSLLSSVVVYRTDQDGAVYFELTPDGVIVNM
jgi:competence protein ComEC